MAKVYIKLDSNNVIIDINSSIFLTSTTGYTLIDEGDGDKYAHAQSQYLAKGLFDEQGRYNYKYINSTVTELTENEKATLFPIDAQPTTTDGSDYGEVGKWDDGNPSGEDRLYRFLTIVGENREIDIAKSDSQIVGVSNLKENVGFLGNYHYGDEKDKSKAIVSILGVAYVKTNDNTIVANDRVMSDDNGLAVKSTNELGYRVLSVPSTGLLEIVVSPNTDMVQRIKKVDDEQDAKIAKMNNYQGITLGTTWTQDSTNGYYTQTVTVDGISAGDTPIIGLQKSGTLENMELQQDEYNKLVSFDTQSGAIKFIASEATTASITLIVKGV